MILSSWFLLSCFAVVGLEADCSRSYSRVVRNVFMQKIEPEFALVSAPIPSGCPFHIERDLYGLQEQYKKLESVGRWVCLFCGKSFFDEPYLDKHFERKHSTKMPQDDRRATCLADYCDIFRCDIITGREVAQYWDKALCRQSELAKLMDKCQHILGSCIPKHLATSQQRQIFDLMNQTVCSYLTCSSYWESLDKEISPAYTALYITAAVFVIFGLLIYYFVAYSHFYTDESLLDGPKHHARSHTPTRSRPGRDGFRQRSNVNSKEIW